MSILKSSKTAWVLSLFYFLTFGGFVALALYLPTFLKEIFNLTPTGAGARTAGFVLLATLMRPVGGIVADKIGGASFAFRFCGNRRFILAFEFRFNCAFYNRRTWLRGSIRVRKRRGFQTRAAVFSEIKRQRLPDSSARSAAWADFSRRSNSDLSKTRPAVTLSVSFYFHFSRSFAWQSII